MNALGSLSDKDLLTYLQDEQHAAPAFAELYNRYHQPVYRYLLNLLKVPQQSEDCLHEVFMKLWEVRMKMEIKGNFSAYLFRVCHNMAINSTRKIARNNLLQTELKYFYHKSVQDEYQSAEKLHRYDQLVDQAMASLTPNRRRVFELCRREGKSYQEAAEILNVSMNTVKEHMSNALACLRNYLEKNGDLAMLAIFISGFF